MRCLYFSTRRDGNEANVKANDIMYLYRRRHLDRASFTFFVEIMSSQIEINDIMLKNPFIIH